MGQAVRVAARQSVPDEIRDGADVVIARVFDLQAFRFLQVQGQHGDVVKLLRPVAEFQQGPVEGVGGILPAALQRFGNAFVAEGLLGGVDPLVQPVGEHQQQIPGLQAQFLRLEGHVLEHTQNGVGLLADAENLSAPAQHGLFMPGPETAQLPASQLQDAEEGGDEDALLVARAELVVDLICQLAQRLIGANVGADQLLGPHHKQGRGNALAGDVRQAEEHPVLVQQEVVVEVAPHLPGGLQEAGQDRVPRPQTALGQRLRLDPGGQVQLRLHFLLPGGFVRQAFQIAQHGVLHQLKALGEDADLVPALHVGGDSLRVSPAQARGKALGGGTELLHVPDDEAVREEQDAQPDEQGGPQEDGAHIEGEQTDAAAQVHVPLPEEDKHVFRPGHRQQGPAGGAPDVGDGAAAFQSCRQGLVLEFACADGKMVQGGALGHPVDHIDQIAPLRVIEEQGGQIQAPGQGKHIHLIADRVIFQLELQHLIGQAQTLLRRENVLCQALIEGSPPVVTLKFHPGGLLQQLPVLSIYRPQLASVALKKVNVGAAEAVRQSAGGLGAEGLLVALQSALIEPGGHQHGREDHSQRQQGNEQQELPADGGFHSTVKLLLKPETRKTSRTTALMLRITRLWPSAFTCFCRATSRRSPAEEMYSTWVKSSSRSRPWVGCAAISSFSWALVTVSRRPTGATVRRASVSVNTVSRMGSDMVLTPFNTLNIVPVKEAQGIQGFDDPQQIGFIGDGPLIAQAVQRLDAEGIVGLDVAAQALIAGGIGQ